MLIPVVPPLVSSYTTLVQFSGALSGVNAPSFTLLTKINGSLITRSGTKIRLVIDSGASNCTINNVTIGPAVTSGNAWNCSSVTAVTRNGSAAWAINGPLGNLYTSDEINFSITAGLSYIVGFNADATADAISARGGLNTGVVAYYKAAVQEADDATRGTGYFGYSGSSYYLNRIEIR